MGKRLHKWKLREDGSIDTFAYADGNHNGPECELCGFSYCHHCDDFSESSCEIFEEPQNKTKDEKQSVHLEFNLFYKFKDELKFLESASKKEDLEEKISFLRKEGTKCTFVIQTKVIKNTYVFYR